MVKSVMDMLSCWPGLDVKVIEELPQFALESISLEIDSFEVTSILLAEDLHCDGSIWKTVSDIHIISGHRPAELST